MSAKEILEQYQFGLARSPKDIPNLVEIFTGNVKKRYPNYWPTIFRSYDADLTNKATAEGITHDI